MNKEEIVGVVKPAICAQLQKPTAAQFPADMISVVGDDVSGYHVMGYVDEQTSDGTSVRNAFSADVAMENGLPVVRSASVAGKKTRDNPLLRYAITLAAFIVLGVVVGYLIVSMLVIRM